MAAWKRFARFTSLHHKLDALHLGDVRERIPANRDQVGEPFSTLPTRSCHPMISAFVRVAARNASDGFMPHFT